MAITAAELLGQVELTRRVASKPRVSRLHVPRPSISDEKVRCVRALAYMGLHHPLVAVICGVSLTTVEDYAHCKRRKAAGLPSDREMFEAGVVLARWGIEERDKKHGIR